MIDRDSLGSRGAKSQHFSEGEIEYLVHLIGEYTEKFRARSEAVRRAKRMKLILIFVCGLLAGTTAFTAWYLYQVDQVVEMYVVSSAVVVLAVLSILAALFGGLSFLSLKRDSWVSRSSDEPWRRRFEDLVRFASQIEDHGAVDSTHRIALMIALGDAEGALRQSDALHRRSIFP